MFYPYPSRYHTRGVMIQVGLAGTQPVTSAPGGVDGLALPDEVLLPDTLLHPTQVAGLQTTGDVGRTVPHHQGQTVDVYQLATRVTGERDVLTPVRRLGATKVNNALPH